jgi:hypothetical protein
MGIKYLQTSSNIQIICLKSTANQVSLVSSKESMPGQEYSLKLTKNDDLAM